LKANKEQINKIHHVELRATMGIKQLHPTYNVINTKTGITEAEPR
jgi:hypothetical protein